MAREFHPYSRQSVISVIVVSPFVSIVARILEHVRANISTATDAFVRVLFSCFAAFLPKLPKVFIVFRLHIFFLTSPRNYSELDNKFIFNDIAEDEAKAVFFGKFCHLNEIYVNERKRYCIK